MSVIIKDIGTDGRGTAMVECRCECGAVRETRKYRCITSSKCRSCSRKKDNSYTISNGVVRMDVSTEKFPNTVTFFDECFLDHVIDGKGRWYATDFSKGIIYVVRSKNGYKLHRHILCPDENSLVDHVDGNGLYNLITNIRVSTHLDNSRNRAIPKNNKTGVLGVYKHSQIDKYVAQISNGVKTISLGCFDTVAEAAEEREKAMRKYGYASGHGKRSAVKNHN